MPTIAQRIDLPKLHSAQKNIYSAFGEKNTGWRGGIRAGRRFGKSTLLETVAANWVLNGDRVGWFTPNYKYLKPSFKRVSRILAPAKRSSSLVDMEFESLTGGAFEGWTLEDDNAGRSRFYDWVVIDEAGLVQRGLGDIWEQAILPTLLDRNGNAIIAGTPKGISDESFFWSVFNTDRFGTWDKFHAPSDRNPHLSPLAMAAFKKQLSPLAYQQEILAEFVDWSGTAFFKSESFLVPDATGELRPVPMPERLESVFAVIDTALKDGKDNDCTAVTYFGRELYGGHPLTVLDWDYVQIEGYTLQSWLPGVFARLAELSELCGARSGSAGAYIEDKGSGTVLLQCAASHGWDATAIPSGFTAAGKDGRAVAVSGHVSSGSVKFSQPAYDKMVTVKGVTKNHLWSQVTSYHLADPDAARRADDCFDTLVYGIGLALGNQEGF